MTIGILALQGSFALHRSSLEALDIAVVEVRKTEHLAGLQGIIIPGGESTTFHLQLTESDLGVQLKSAIQNGLPAWGTCAGAILLANGEGRPQPRWRLVKIEAVRNAYGRQVDSFIAPLDIEGFETAFDGVFIRAPKFRLLDDGVSVLARHNGDPVLVAQKNIILTSFHPELTNDLRMHNYFIQRFCRS
ncbi:MAG: pyridoxal 5'-phosphate synthase glutaminase subunit PdxT [Calditrichaeota bacterium]|nr:pyridoxal 5'-phosphate synthase glutaminase subunit PdxT [Calditrichota bacterium]